MSYTETQSGSMAKSGATTDNHTAYHHGYGEGDAGEKTAIMGHSGDAMTESDDNIITAVTSSIKSAESYWGAPNVGTYDRIASGIAGAALTYFATRSTGMQRTGLATAGGYLILRGATGHCVLNHALRTGSNRPNANGAAVIPHGQGIKVVKSVTIQRSAQELFDFWHQFDNLPRFMDHLVSVTILDGDKSHWVAKAPLGQTVEWDAEIIAERPNQKIAWRSLESADVPNAGTVLFEDKGDRGTQVTVTLEYNPPAGFLGAAIAKIWGEEPNQQVYSDLLRFKALMETGEIPTITGQPIGAGKGRVQE